jgi:hypothetical protein
VIVIETRNQNGISRATFSAARPIDSITILDLQDLIHSDSEDAVIVAAETVAGSKATSSQIISIIAWRVSIVECMYECQPMKRENERASLLFMSSLLRVISPYLSP